MCSFAHLHETAVFRGLHWSSVGGSLCNTAAVFKTVFMENAMRCLSTKRRRHEGPRFVIVVGVSQWMAGSPCATCSEERPCVTRRSLQRPGSAKDRNKTKDNQNGLVNVNVNNVPCVIGRQLVGPSLAHGCALAAFDGWLVAWGLCGCGCVLICFSPVWLLPFTLL